MGRHARAIHRRAADVPAEAPPKHAPDVPPEALLVPLGVTSDARFAACSVVHLGGRLQMISG